MRKRIIYIVAILLFLIVLYALVKQMSDSLRAGTRMETEMEALTKLQQKNTELKKRLAEVDSPQFIEGQARDRLNFARPGETVAIIPQEELDRILGASKVVSIQVLPYWQGWLQLFWR